MKLPRLSSIGRKQAVALSGLFLCLFLAVHLAGNLQLLIPGGESKLRFNHYSALLSGNPLIKVAGWLTYAALLGHAALAFWLTHRNARARGDSRYALERVEETSSWSSRNMGILGALLLVFLVVHLADFWFPYHYGELERDAAGRRDLHGLVIESFQNPGALLFYGVCMLGLGAHLVHGIPSALRTLGVAPPRYYRLTSRVGIAFALLCGLGFALLPLIVFLRGGV